MSNTGIMTLGSSVTSDTKYGTAIIVVGVSRGGTSAISASLQALGISMGAKFHTPIYEDLALAESFRAKDWRQLKIIIKEYEASNKIFGWKLPDSHRHLDRIYKY